MRTASIAFFVSTVVAIPVGPAAGGFATVGRTFNDDTASRSGGGFAAAGRQGLLARQNEDDAALLAKNLDAPAPAQLAKSFDAANTGHLTGPRNVIPGFAAKNLEAPNLDELRVTTRDDERIAPAPNADRIYRRGVFGDDTHALGRPPANALHERQFDGSGIRGAAANDLVAPAQLAVERPPAQQLGPFAAAGVNQKASGVI